MKKPNYNRKVHDVIALTVLVSLVLLSLHDAHSLLQRIEAQPEVVFSAHTPEIYAYLLLIAYVGLFYTEYSLDQEMGVKPFRLLLHFLTLLLGLFPHFYVWESPVDHLEVMQARVIRADIIMPLLLFAVIEVLIYYWVWHIKHRPPGQQGGRSPKR